jgi:hypothetical protein
MSRMAIFETFAEAAEREKSGVPYNDTYISRCRQKAIEYSKLNKGLRAHLLRELEKDVPFHFRNKVFEGIVY